MLILSSGPLRTGSTVWHTRNGSFVLTLVCKTTFWLKPGESVIAAEQEAVNEADDHWDDDPNRSVRAPSDYMPNKLRPEVTLVGYAYAPNNQPVRSLVARMVVGEVDKAIEVHVDRTFLPDGTLHEGPRFTRMRLTWERAAGGPGTSNPVGMRPDVRDAYGRRAVPNLQALGTYVTTRDDFIAPVGFGPIAATWPSRADLLGRAPPAVGEGLEGHTAAYYNAAPADQQLAMLRENERIVLENLHPDHQRLVTSLPGYRPAIFVERAEGKPSRVAANADSLWIDTDRGIATLTWRAMIPLAQKDEPGQVLVALEPPGREVTWSDMLRLISADSSQSDDDDDIPIDTITTTGSLIQAAAVLPFASRMEGAPALREPMRSASHADMPFQPALSPSTIPPATATPWPTLQTPPPPPTKAPPSVPAPALPTSARGSLPGTLVTANRGASPPLPVSTTPPPVVPQPPPVRPPSMSLSDATAPQPPPPVRPPTVSLSDATAPQPPPPVRPPTVSLSDIGASSLDKPRAPASPWASGSAGAALTQPQTIGSQAVAASAAAAVVPLIDTPKESLSLDVPAKPAPAPPARANKPASSFDAAFGGPKAGAAAAPIARISSPSTGEPAFGLKAASDAAAVRSESLDAPRERTGRIDASGLDDVPGARRRNAVVNLLCFDAQILPRLRRSKRFASALAPKNRAKRAQGLDEPQKDTPPDDRSEVLRALSCGQAADAAEIRRALADCLDDLEEFEPPVLLVAGEMHPVFDELEMLRTTIAVAQLVAGADKKLLASIAVGQEAVAAPVPPRPETTLGFVRQIEQAAASLNLPTRYVQAEVERVLTENRKYKRRTLLGAPRIRADLTLRGGEVMAMYLPDSAASSLPLLLAYPVLAICEVTPREDMSESQDEALVVFALGRVLRSR